MSCLLLFACYGLTTYLAKLFMIKRSHSYKSQNSNDLN